MRKETEDTNGNISHVHELDEYHHWDIHTFQEIYKCNYYQNFSNIFMELEKHTEICTDP